MMTAIEHRIREVVLTAHRANWGTLEVVAYEDGGYGLVLNGELLSCFHWNNHELEDCLATVRRLIGPQGSCSC